MTSDTMKSSETTSGSVERDIFFRALEKPPGKERAAFLDGACGNCQALRQRLEALLRQFEGLGTFLEEPAVSLPKPLHNEAPPELIEQSARIGTVSEKVGDRIGRYK